MGAGFPGGLGTAGNVITRGGGNTSAQTKVTFVAVARISASGYYPVIVSLKGGNTTNQGLYLGDTYGSGKDIGVIKGGVGSLNAVNLAAGTYVFVASHRQDTGEYYMLARDLATGRISVATQTNTSASTGGNGTYAIGATRTDTAALNGAVYLAFASFDFLPRAAGQRLLLNPWQLFAPIERRSWASVGASAPTLIAASAINLTSTSFRPRVTFTR